MVHPIGPRARQEAARPEAGPAAILSGTTGPRYTSGDASPETVLAGARPPELERLLDASDDASRDRSWEAFLATHTQLLLRTARFACGHEHDLTMDAYAFVLEALRQDDLRRLRAYAATEQSAFSSWLAVVARRLCADFLRRRYGRVRGADPSGVERVARRRLADLVASDADPDQLAAAPDHDPDLAMDERESADALASALATLEPRDRLLVKLRFEDDASVPRIARLMSFPTPFHAYRRLNKVLAILREDLRHRGVRGGNP